MTQPRLRSTVTYLPTSSGMLFRNGDAFLPVSGAGIWSSFQSVKPLLEGKPVSEVVRREWSENAQGQLGKLYRALKCAGMLYEPSDEDLAHISDAVLARFRPELAGVELKSDGPLAAFAGFRRKRFAIVGRCDLALAITAAALESGLCNLTLLCPDWTSNHNDELQRIVHNHTIEPDGPSATALKWAPSLLQIPDCDGFMLAAALESGDDFLTTALRVLLNSDVQLGIAMLIGTSRLITSVCDPFVACQLCIASSLIQEPQSAAISPLHQSSRDVEVGARILLRHFWDAHLHGPLSIAHHTMVELNLRTYDISRRPRPHRSACLTHPALLSMSLPSPELSRHCINDPHSKLEFCKRAEALCVDRDTGLIRALEEGDLLQFPRHQCAARLSEDDTECDAPWLIECGREMVEARAGAIRKALERHYGRYFQRTHAQAPVGNYYNTSGEPERKRAEIPFGDGVTVSGQSWAEVVEQGFFRALARHSLVLDSWIQINIMLEIPDDPEVGLVAEHLKDVNAFDSIVVYEQFPSLSECPILRFDHHGRTVSVVAGLDRVLAWRIGLEDIWMDLAAADAFEPCGTAHPTRAQFRAALSSSSAEDRADSTARLESRLGMKLCIFPIAVEDSMKLLSLSFAYACLALAPDGQTAQACEERPATLACSEER
jgi:hypothetical protein